jgi:hypothetical protein
MSEEQTKIIRINNSIPFFLRAIAVLFMVTGLLGLLFYAGVMIFQIAGRNFLYEFRYKGFGETGLYAIIAVYILLNFSLMLSGLKLLRLRKTGIYLYGISYVVFLLLSYVLQDNFGWFVLAIGFFIFIIILLHLRKLN